MSVIIDQNYKKVSDCTANAFQVLAKRIYCHALISHWQEQNLKQQQNIQFNNYKTINTNSQIKPKQNLSQIKKIKKQGTKQMHQDQLSQINLKQIKIILPIFFNDIIYLTIQHQKNNYFIMCQMKKVYAIKDCTKNIKNPNTIVRKCLFRIQQPQDSKIKKEKPKSLQVSRINQNQLINGKNLQYGNYICLRNLFTGTHLSMDTTQPSRSKNGVNVNLYQQGKDVFFILSMDNQQVNKRQVFSQSTIKLILAKDPYYKINMDQNLINNCYNEIKGNVAETALNLHCYISSNPNLRSQLNAKAIQDGDLLLIRNQKTQTYLSVSEKKISQYVQNKSIKMQINFFQNNSIQNICEQNHNYNSLDQTKIYSGQSFQVCFEKNKQIKFHKNFSSYSIWQIQKIQNFKGGFILPNYQFKLKNVATSMFLAVSKTNNNQLILQTDFNQDNCKFKIKLKRQGQNNFIQENECFKLYAQNKQYFLIEKYLKLEIIRLKIMIKLNIMQVCNQILKIQKINCYLIFSMSINKKQKQFKKQYKFTIL